MTNRTLPVTRTQEQRTPPVGLGTQPIQNQVPGLTTVDVTGRWTYENYEKTSQGDVEVRREIILNQTGKQVTGTYMANSMLGGSKEYEIKSGFMQGNRVEFVGTSQDPGDQLSFSGTAEGNMLRGKLTYRYVGMSFPEVVVFTRN